MQPEFIGNGMISFKNETYFIRSVSLENWNLVERKTLDISNLYLFKCESISTRRQITFNVKDYKTYPYHGTSNIIEINFFKIPQEEI